MKDVLAVSLLVACLVLPQTKAEDCVGCLTSKDPNDFQYLNILQQALEVQNWNSGFPKKILKVQEQIVAGRRYNIEFSTKEGKICNVDFVIQEWISKTPQYFKNKGCRSPALESTSPQSRSVFGSLKEIDSSESQLVKELSELAIKTLDDVDEDNIRRTVVDVIDAKKQLVNGIMYYLECKVQDTSCLEDQNVEVDDSCLSQTTGSPKICKIRLHRSFADKSPHSAKVVSSECKDEFEVVGAITDAQANSQYIRDMAQYASEHLNSMTNSIYWFKLADILEAKTQIANGINTFLTLELHSTNCLKHDRFKSDKVCGIDPETQSKMVCHLMVWEQPWKNKKQIKKTTCSTLDKTKKVKRSILGDESTADFNDQKIEDLKHYLSTQLTSRANSEYTKIVVEVLNATTQIVSGTLTRASVRVADTTCLKSENKSPRECKESSQGHQICHVTILEQPWVNKKELTQSECHAVPPKMDVGTPSEASAVVCLYKCDPKLE